MGEGVFNELYIAGKSMGNIILCGLSWMMSSDYQFPVCNAK